MTELKNGQSWKINIWGYSITNTKPTRSEAITEALRQATELFKTHITERSINSIRRVSHIHKFEQFHTNDNPYEGGTIYRKCACGILQTASEDGTDTLNKYDSKFILEMMETEEYQKRIKRQMIQEFGH